MNERIRQLVRQAGLDDADFPIEDWDNVPLAKFAQLIVQECILVIEEEAEHIHAEGTIEAIVNLEKHFGVE